MPRYASKLTPEQWAEARRMWDDGEPTADIGAALGVTGSGIAWRARRDGWPVRHTVPEPRRPFIWCACCGCIEQREIRTACSHCAAPSARVGRAA